MKDINWKLLRMHYLDDRKQIHQVDSWETYEHWASWMSLEDRHVAETIIGDVRVSTVFLLASYPDIDGGPPFHFETMTFGIKEELPEFRRQQWRYRTWGDAVVGHNLIVEALTKNRKVTADPGGN